MKKVNKWLIWLLIMMVISLLISGFFFLKSGLIDFENEKVNEEVIHELELFEAKIKQYFNFPISTNEEKLLNNPDEEKSI